MRGHHTCISDYWKIAFILLVDAGDLDNSQRLVGCGRAGTVETMSFQLRVLDTDRTSTDIASTAAAAARARP